MNHGQHKDFTEIAAIWCGYTGEQAENLVKGALIANSVIDLNWRSAAGIGDQNMRNGVIALEACHRADVRRIVLTWRVQKSTTLRGTHSRLGRKGRILAPSGPWYLRVAM